MSQKTLRYVLLVDQLICIDFNKLGLNLWRSSLMATGEVKWFNNAKGWGFIVPEGSSEDIFVHFSSIQGTGYKTLAAGQVVDFTIEKGQRGLHAIEVVSIDETVCEPSL